MSFDQAGFVYSMRTSRSSFINFGFSYTKSKNFAQILSATDKLNGASQNKLSAMKNLNGIYKFDGSNGLNANYATYSQVDHLYSNVLFNHYNADNASDPNNAVLNNGVIVKESSPTTPVYFNATDYQFGRATSGYIGEYNFNISGNSNDRFYWGLTFGLYDVHYNGSSDYAENLVDGSNPIGNILMSDDRKITGTGFDIKGGIIFRPVEESPFRVGLYVHTPTWYDLTTKNYTTLDISNLNQGYGSINKDKSYESYDFKFYTPWRFGVSLGHTVGNYLAIGATYEYADYSTCDIRINDGGTVDEWGYYYDESHSDGVMKQSIKNSLKGVHTLKLGVEFKPEKNFAVRLGYNYLSAMYSKDGYKDGSLDSYGTYYSSTTDYTNWKDTHRITAGFGYAFKNWNFDIAYQYSQTNGDFYPFMSYVDQPTNAERVPAFDNVCNSTKVSNKRNQVLMTIGYKF